VLRNLLATILVVALSFSTVCAWASEQVYYYYQGKKVYVDLTNRIAVRTVRGVDASDLFRLILGSAKPFSSIRLEGEGLWLIELKTPVQPDELSLLARRLASHPAVEFAAPVFASSNEELVLLDEFIVKFKENVSELDILRLNAANSVIVARRGPLPGTFVLKVTPRSKLNALEMANLYYEQGVVVYSQPNFIRLGQR
jgi:hypothetical protein